MERKRSMPRLHELKESWVGYFGYKMHFREKNIVRYKGSHSARTAGRFVKKTWWVWAFLSIVCLEQWPRSCRLGQTAGSRCLWSPTRGSTSGTSRAGWTKETGRPSTLFRSSKIILLFLESSLAPKHVWRSPGYDRTVLPLKKHELPWFCQDWEGQPLLPRICSWDLQEIDSLLKQLSLSPPHLHSVLQSVFN